MKHLVITVHGIRTFGGWQERLEILLRKEGSDRELQVVNYKFGYLSVFRFIVPFLRSVEVRRFWEFLVDMAQEAQWDRIDLVGHSFGTYLIGSALLSIRQDSRPKVNTIIFSGSVLSSNFPWRLLIDRGLQRLVNDCGNRDDILVLNQMTVWGTGMAGRLGFNGGTGRNFRNRYFNFGHSDYFLKDGKPDSTFMQHYWVPLILTDAEPELVDLRTAGAFTGVKLVLLENAEPIKFALYASPITVIAATFILLYFQAESARKQTADALKFAQAQQRLANEQKDRALLSQSRVFSELSRQQRQEGNSANALALALEASPDARFGIDRPWLVEADASLGSALSALHERAVLRGHTNHISKVAFSPDGKSLLTASWDYTMRLSDVATHRLIRQFNCNDSAINDAAFSSDGKLIVAASTRGDACVFDVESGNLVQKLSRSKQELRYASFSSDGSRIATASDGDAVRLWDATTGEQIAAFDLKRRTPSPNFRPMAGGFSRLRRAPSSRRFVPRTEHFSSILSALPSPSKVSHLHRTASMSPPRRLTARCLSGILRRRWPA